MPIGRGEQLGVVQELEVCPDDACACAAVRGRKPLEPGCKALARVVEPLHFHRRARALFGHGGFAARDAALQGRARVLRRR